MKTDIDLINGQILNKIDATKVIKTEVIQSLWSNYGVLYRLITNSPAHPSVIVKYIKPPENLNHPRGWNTSTSHSRKMTSYQVESEFYLQYAHESNKNIKCQVPKYITSLKHRDEKVLIIQDLNQIGYEARKNKLSISEARVCISWLANFHATFLDLKPNNLWPVGTYWHLNTRTEELENIKDKHIRELAPLINHKLCSTSFKTLVHGDAKVANFCFSQDLSRTAAVDFQYVGTGNGMMDLTYFMSSIFTENECEKYEHEILNLYFEEIKLALIKQNKKTDMKKLETEWREIYPYAWADLHRFLLGWNPDHWKINRYTQKMIDLVRIELS